MVVATVSALVACFELLYELVTDSMCSTTAK